MIIVGDRNTSFETRCRSTKPKISLGSKLVDCGTTCEALLRLRRRGLIEQDGPRALRVVQLSADDVRQTYEIRQALESFTAGRAALTATPEDSKQILAAAKASLVGAKTADIDSFRRADRELHQKIASLADNPRVAQLIADAGALLSTLLQRDLPAGQGLTNCGEAHVRIAEAIAAGNREACCERDDRAHRRGARASVGDHRAGRARRGWVVKARTSPD